MITAGVGQPLMTQMEALSAYMRGNFTTSIASTTIAVTTRTAAYDGISAVLETAECVRRHRHEQEPGHDGDGVPGRRPRGAV